MRIIKIHKKDNVAVALDWLHAGEVIKMHEETITVKDEIPQGNKISLQDTAINAEVIKYGNPIGRASRQIMAGQLVHSHNMETALQGRSTYDYNPVEETDLCHVVDHFCEDDVFCGYRRGDGTVGIRNEIWILPTVGCVNSIGRKLADIGKKMICDEIDGVYCWEHPYGCSQLGDDLENTKRILKCLCDHGNAGGILVLSLGCENLNLEALGILPKKVDGKIIKTMNCQEAGDELEMGKKLLREIIHAIRTFKRQEISMSELVVGLKCGGSDGFSGITANPLIGHASDRMVDLGASVLMSEVPEMFGAEHLLMNRCVDRSVFQKMESMVKGFQSYYLDHGMPIHENPSPGNKKGGITTLEEKSLGCIQKGGSSRIKEVYEYGRKVKKKGLQIIEAPGNDLVSMTAMAAAGAHLILFSTGRGTPTGAVVPTIKIATNSALAEKKARWIDYNGGKVLEHISMDDAAEELIQLIKNVSSGRMWTKNEQNSIREFAIFKTGVTL